MIADVAEYERRRAAARDSPDELPPSRSAMPRVGMILAAVDDNELLELGAHKAPSADSAMTLLRAPRSVEGGKVRTSLMLVDTSESTAWLARERLAGRPGNAPRVTGASRPGLLGAIHA